MSLKGNRARESAEDVRLKAELKKKQEKAKKDLRRDLNQAFATGAGIQALRYLKETCGFDKPDAVASVQSGEILDRSTLYNLARRSIYIELRKLIKPTTLVRAEFPELYHGKEK